MKALDTNVLVRYLMQDDEEQSLLADNFVFKFCTTETPGYINLIVLVELAWVLGRSYNYSRIQIGQTIENILNTPQLKIEHSGIAREALSSYRTSSVDFADLIIAATNRAAGYALTATFDKKAGKLPGFELLG